MSQLRFYSELAEWWPLISPVEDYADETAYFAALLNGPNVLELGSGGGHNAYHLKHKFNLTLV